MARLHKLYYSRTNSWLYFGSVVISSLLLTSSYLYSSFFVCFWEEEKELMSVFPMYISVYIHAVSTRVFCGLKLIVENHSIDDPIHGQIGCAVMENPCKTPLYSHSMHNILLRVKVLIYLYIARSMYMYEHYSTIVVRTHSTSLKLNSKHGR